MSLQNQLGYQASLVVEPTLDFTVKGYVHTLVVCLTKIAHWPLRVNPVATITCVTHEPRVKACMAFEKRCPVKPHCRARTWPLAYIKRKFA